MTIVGIDSQVSSRTRETESREWKEKGAIGTGWDEQEAMRQSGKRVSKKGRECNGGVVDEWCATGRGADGREGKGKQDGEDKEREAKAKEGKAGGRES